MKFEARQTSMGTRVHRNSFGLNHLDFQAHRASKWELEPNSNTLGKLIGPHNGGLGKIDPIPKHLA